MCETEIITIRPLNPVADVATMLYTTLEMNGNWTTSRYILLGWPYTVPKGYFFPLSGPKKFNRLPRFAAATLAFGGAFGLLF